jgi:curved DNA-binding protein CbpA
MDKTLYDLIGVPSHASPDEIQSACIALGQRLANDKSTNIKAEYEFAELERAYEVLGNPDKRREYDLTIGIVSIASSGNWQHRQELEIVDSLVAACS